MLARDSRSSRRATRCGRSQSWRTCSGTTLRGHACNQSRSPTTTCSAAVTRARIGVGPARCSCAIPRPADGCARAASLVVSLPDAREGRRRKARPAVRGCTGARHTAGQTVLDRTGNLKAVQKLLGHSSITTTADDITPTGTMTSLPRRCARSRGGRAVSANRSRHPVLQYRSRASGLDAPGRNRTCAPFPPPGAAADRRQAASSPATSPAPRALSSESRRGRGRGTCPAPSAVLRLPVNRTPVGRGLGQDPYDPHGRSREADQRSRGTVPRTPAGRAHPARPFPEIKLQGQAQDRDPEGQEPHLNRALRVQVERPPFLPKIAHLVDAVVDRACHKRVVASALPRRESVEGSGLRLPVNNQLPVLQVRLTPCASSRPAASWRRRHRL